jgi:hypothetical protein
VSNGFELAPGRGKKITVNGEESTPIVHESTQAVAADGDRYSGLSQWTLAL